MSVEVYNTNTITMTNLMIFHFLALDICIFDVNTKNWIMIQQMTT